MMIILLHPPSLTQFSANLSPNILGFKSEQMIVKSMHTIVHYLKSFSKTRTSNRHRRVSVVSGIITPLLCLLQKT